MVYFVTKNNAINKLVRASKYWKLLKKFLSYRLICFIIIDESIGFVKILHCRFLMDLHVPGWSEHDLTVSGNFCLCVCDKNFVPSAARELIDKI